MISSLRLSISSMCNRFFSTTLTMLSIAMTVALLLSIDRIREGVRHQFEQTLSGMDLVVGPRGGSLNVLLYSVFHIGSPNNNVSWKSYESLRAHPEVAWTIPISMGDSHRSYPVIGTDDNFFQHFKVAGQSLSFQDGRAFHDGFEAVLGADVAKKLGYKVGHKIVLSHGMGEASFHSHDENPFAVVGILKKTGTPADRTVHIRLDSLDALHHEWVEDEHEHEHEHEHDEHEHDEASGTPRSISAFMVGLKSRMGILSFQRMVNEYAHEPVMAVIPGLAFKELWTLVSSAEAALLVISVFVMIVAMLGMLASLLTTLENRRREIAILRAVGARPSSIFALVLSEAIFLGLGAYILGFASMFPLVASIGPWFEQRYGFRMSMSPHLAYDLPLLGAVLVFAVLAGVIPALRAYRRSLADGLSVRI